MNGAFKHPLRVGSRLVWLAGEMAWIALNYIPRVVLRSGCPRLEAKARWLQWGCRRVVPIFSLAIHTAAPPPRRGLLVSNHLSYIDVLVLSALTPSVFVAKREVKSWPVFGLFARLAGTVFVNRRQRVRAGASARELGMVLAEGGLAILFPEGTSSDGQQVLPFKSALLESVVRHTHTISASAIHYELASGDVREEVCYWKDMTLLPHLLNLLSKKSLTVHVRFSQIERGGSDRKVLASQLHAEVSRLNALSRNGSASAVIQPRGRCAVAVGGWRVQGCQVLAGRGGVPSEK